MLALGVLEFFLGTELVRWQSCGTPQFHTQGWSERLQVVVWRVGEIYTAIILTRALAV